MQYHLHAGIRLFIASCATLLFTCQHTYAQDLCDDEDFAFYGIGNAHSSPHYNAVYKLQFTSSGVVVDTANEIPGPVGVNMQGIGIADLGSGHTFYSITNAYTPGNVFKRDVYEYNGSGWSVVFTDSSTTFPTGNIAGNGGYLYYHNIRFPSTTLDWPAAIQRFTGTGFTTLLIDSGDLISYPVADIAVDNSGNVFYFTGDDTTDKTKVTHLNVMSPTGQLLQSMPVTIQGPNLYGCFFKENVLWVCCLGTATIAYPHMIPVTIQGTTASAGAHVAIPKPALGYSTGPNGTSTIYLSFNDQASCTSTDVMEPNAVGAQAISEYSIFPNPATNTFAIRMPFAASRTLAIYNGLGQLCHSANMSGNEWTVDCSRFRKGLYLVKISSSEGEYAHRLVIE